MNAITQPPVATLTPPELAFSRPVFWFGGLILLFAVPFFLRMPLTNDAMLFDLQSQMIVEGHVAYRDVLEPNWPGVLAVHTVVRAIFGTSSEALRWFDLLCLLLLAGMLRKLTVMAGVTLANATWISLVVLVFYLGSSEWCHCQRDTWLLVPMVAATLLRMRRLNDQLTPKVCAGSAFAEGLIWGAACWLKPYAVLIAAAVWLVTLVRFGSLRRAVIDTGLVALGGLLVLGCGVAWLMKTGAWPYFVETMRDWNPRYLAAGRANWDRPRFVAMVLRMQPWYWLHLLAIPLAGKQLLSKSGSNDVTQIASDGERSATLPIESHLEPSPSLPFRDSSSMRTVLVAVYLATLAHVFLLQHLFDYVHAPSVMLAIVVVGTWLNQPERSRRWRIAVFAFGLFVALQSPLLKPHRARLWWACVKLPLRATFSERAKLQDRLALLPNPHRTHLERVAEFLSQKNLARNEVNMLNSDVVGLYERLNLRPPTRFVYVWELLLYFPQQRDLIMSELANSGHRYVVSDLVSCGMSPADAWAVGPDGPHAPPPKYRANQRGRYPWSHPVIYRSGPYMVHEVSGPIGKPGSL